jgi:N-acetylglucosaminyldiphosphoundecaprenol N-acetyl-beta-D-mannosaminyltransferase
MAVRDKRLGTNPRVVILDAQIDVLDFKETIALVEEYVQEKEPLHLIGVNADKLNEMAVNEDLHRIVNNCGIINADGASVVLASRFLKKNLPERVAGIDLMNSLVALSEERGYSIFLLGAKQDVVEKTAQVLEERHPRLRIVGVRNGYFTKEEWPTIAESLKKADPDFVFVGITSPLKEYLVEYLQEQGNRCVFMGVGGSFDVISGKIKRAPVWVQSIHMEWFYRMLQEPKRLAKRYLVGNWKFIVAILKEKWRKL